MLTFKTFKPESFKENFSPVTLRERVAEFINDVITPAKVVDIADHGTAVTVWWLDGRDPNAPRICKRPGCGVENRPQARFCKRCGTRLPGLSAPESHC